MILKIINYNKKVNFTFIDDAKSLLKLNSGQGV